MIESLGCPTRAIWPVLTSPQLTGPSCDFARRVRAASVVLGMNASQI